MPFLSVLIFILMAIGSLMAQNTLVSSGNYFEGEPSLAIDPSNNQHLIAAWMGFQFNQKIVIKSSVSWNGGTSWTPPIFQSHESAGNSSADVSLGFDPQGNAYMCYIDYDNVGFSEGKVVVRKSTDGGISWSNSAEAINITDCPGQLCIDRPWMVIDPSGSTVPAALYITTMNADQPSMVLAPYHPYLSVSVDGGQTFLNPRHLDTLNFLAGATIPQPMPSPAVDGNGRFYAIYPSYLNTQSLYPRHVLAYTNDQGNSLDHLIAYQGVNIGVSNSQLKRAGKLMADESHPGHLAYCFLCELNDASDVYFMETNDGGSTWSTMQRVNQDPIGNNRIQDLVWGDFNEQGNLVITWRDRRNAPGDGYNQPSEVYAATKAYGASGFTQDYPITSQGIPHDTILEASGNDFMSVVYVGDSCYAVWGDVRSGTLKIYLNKWHVGNPQNNLFLIGEEFSFNVYPNPSSDKLTINLPFEGPFSINIFDEMGKLVFDEPSFIGNTIDIAKFKGTYSLEIFYQGKTYSTKFKAAK